jgi:hypothetical protein
MEKYPIPQPTSATVIPSRTYGEKIFPVYGKVRAWDCQRYKQTTRGRHGFPFFSSIKD